MKILEINKFFYPQGGADKHFLDVIDLLKEKGHKVAVFSMKDPRNIQTYWEKYFVSHVGYSSDESIWEKFFGIFRIFYSFEAKKKIRQLLIDFRPDIVHIHNIYHQISPSILGEIKKKNIPIVMTVHDYNLICPNYNFFFSGTDWQTLGKFRSLKFLWKKGFKDSYFKSLWALLEYWWNKINKTYEKNINLFIAPSYFLKNKLVQGGMMAEKIVVLPHFGKGMSSDILPEKNAVFHFGRLSRSKGTQDIIDIFKELPGVELRLAGNMEEDLIFGNCPNIKYLGFLSQNEIQKEIQSSMFVISASRLPETFGLVSLETLENGKSFVALETGAYSEIIENGKEGYLCQNLTELKEKIILLSGDSRLQQEMNKNALEKAKKFNRDIYYQKFMKRLTFLVENARF